MDRRDSPRAPERLLPRRDVLKLAAILAGSASASAFLGACAARREPSSSRPTSSAGASSGPLTMIASGDPLAEPPLRKVLDDFAALHPGIEWDVRALTGAGPEWDRLARAMLSSGEPVDLVMINGQQVRAWARDGLLADLSADPDLESVLARVPERYQIGGPGDTARRAVPLAAARGLQITGLYYNGALLAEAGLERPTTIADLEAMVEPLARLGASPLAHCAGDVFFNQILITWILPMILERSGADPLAFADRTVKGDVDYDSSEWIEAFATIARLRESGVMLEGSGALDYAGMQQVLLQGKAAATLQGSWMLPQIQAGTASGPFDLHVAPPPLVEGAERSRPILAWTGFGMPATAARSRDAASSFLEYASRPDVDREITAGTQAYSPIAASNDVIEDPLAREFLPLFEDEISPLDWLWEPEITAEIDSQVQALLKGTTDPASVGGAVQAVAEDLRSSGRSYYP
jgi:raffinose/stachyose/melibiose transport system substrate-binding protein